MIGTSIRRIANERGGAMLLKRVGSTASCASRSRGSIRSTWFPMTAADCYRFVLSNPAVDVCMMGARSREEMSANLKVLDSGPFSDAEMERAVRIGDFLHGD